MYMYVYLYIHTYIHTYIPTYLHTYIHTYIHTHMHIYIYIMSFGAAQATGFGMPRRLWCWRQLGASTTRRGTSSVSPCGSKYPIFEVSDPKGVWLLGPEASNIGYLDPQLPSSPKGSPLMNKLNKGGTLGVGYRRVVGEPMALFPKLWSQIPNS